MALMYCTVLGVLFGILTGVFAKDAFLGFSFFCVMTVVGVVMQFAS